MDAAIIIVAIIAFLAGGAAGWFAAWQGKQGELRAAKDTTESLRATLDGVTAERDAARGELAETGRRLSELQSEYRVLEATQAEWKRGQEEKLAELRAFNEQARQQLAEQFSSVGNKLLGEAQKQFLERADQRFEQASEKSNERIQGLLKPVNERLSAYEESVRKIENERRESYGDLKSLMDQMRVGQMQVRDETHRLVNSLRNAPKARGRWGEQQLRNVLETCGLAEHTDFVMEASVATEDGRLRPDAVVTVPGGRKLVIDAKVSLNAYQDAFEADGEEARVTALTAHCQSMKAHIEGLSRKAYWDQFDEAPDYVIMFVPGEHFLTAALEHDPALWDHAFDKRVLLATPTNLVAIARTVAGVWRQEKLAKEAQQIGQLGKELHERLATTAEHLKRVGAGLNSAVGNYNKFVGSYERNVLSTGRKFAELNIETGKKAIEQIPEIEALPRYSSDDLDEEAAE